jgi:transposase
MEEVSDCPGCRSRDARIAELEAAVRALAAQVKDLTARLDDKIPPQRPKPDLPAAPDKKPSGRQPGGQPGHPPHLKTRLPPERITETIPLIPTACRHCQAALPQEPGPDDPAPSWHQVVELPKVTVTVTEYQGHTRTCPCCGQVNHAPIPDDVRRHSVGPHLTAVLGYLTGGQGISKRGVEEIAETIFGAPIALGTVSKLEQELSAAVAVAHAQATAAVRDAAVKHIDETGWKENGQKRWLWVAATRLVAVFVIHPWRNVEALKSLLGGQLLGILCSDRWVVYRQWPDPFARQLCWAHLKRNWEKLVERGGAAKRFGERCLAIHRQVFELWHRFRGGGGTRDELSARMQPHVEALQEVILSGAECRDPRTRRFCARLLTDAYGLWTFVDTDGVEPTNNHGERVLRFGVIWRRRSFGCHSAAGCRYVERMLTVVQTLRLQKRNIVAYLSDSIAAHREGKPGPKLVPVG